MTGCGGGGDLAHPQMDADEPLWRRTADICGGGQNLASGQHVRTHEIRVDEQRRGSTASAERQRRCSGSRLCAQNGRGQRGGGARAADYDSGLIGFEWRRSRAEPL
jgi:hypothetical protein